MLSQNLCSVGEKPQGSGNLPVLIVGNRGGWSIGESFARACDELGTPFVQIESSGAMHGPALLRRLLWRLWDHRPIRLERFSAEVVDLFVRGNHL